MLKALLKTSDIDAMIAVLMCYLFVLYGTHIIRLDNSKILNE